jgi:hypothetical protein
LTNEISLYDHKKLTNIDDKQTQISQRVNEIMAEKELDIVVATYEASEADYLQAKESNTSVNKVVASNIAKGEMPTIMEDLNNQSIVDIAKEAGVSPGELISQNAKINEIHNAPPGLTKRDVLPPGLRREIEEDIQSKSNGEENNTTESEDYLGQVVPGLSEGHPKNSAPGLADKENPSDNAPGKTAVHPSDNAPGQNKQDEDQKEVNEDYSGNEAPGLSEGHPKDSAPGLVDKEDPSKNAPGKTEIHPSDNAPGKTESEEVKKNDDEDSLSKEAPGLSEGHPKDSAPGLVDKEDPSKNAPGKTEIHPSDNASGKTESEEVKKNDDEDSLSKEAPGLSEGNPKDSAPGLVDKEDPSKNAPGKTETHPNDKVSVKPKKR